MPNPELIPISPSYLSASGNLVVDPSPFSPAIFSGSISPGFFFTRIGRLLVPIRRVADQLQIQHLAGTALLAVGPISPGGTNFEEDFEAYTTNPTPFLGNGVSPGVLGAGTWSVPPLTTLGQGQWTIASLPLEVAAGIQILPNTRFGGTKAAHMVRPTIGGVSSAKATAPVSPGIPAAAVNYQFSVPIFLPVLPVTGQFVFEVFCGLAPNPQAPGDFGIQIIDDGNLVVTDLAGATALGAGTVTTGVVHTLVVTVDTAGVLTLWLDGVSVFVGARVGVVISAIMLRQDGTAGAPAGTIAEVGPISLVLANNLALTGLVLPDGTGLDLHSGPLGPIPLNNIGVATAGPGVSTFSIFTPNAG